MGEADLPNSEGKKPINKLFTPLSTGFGGIPLLSPEYTLDKKHTFDDQLLLDFPKEAENHTKAIKKLFENNIVPKGPIIEIGSGAGILVEHLRKHGLEAYGVDILAYKTAWAHRKIKDFMYLGNVEDMPGVNSESFKILVTNAFWDTAFSTANINNPHSSLAEINRVLMIGGIFVPFHEWSTSLTKLDEMVVKFGFKKMENSDWIGHAYIKESNFQPPSPSLWI